MATFEETYPSIADWVLAWGWIEIGDDGESVGFVRALDEGGLVWESDQHYKSLDEMFRALDKALEKHMGR